jgi:2-iminobutanoate/2-iminopropanoate deaminase
MLRKQALTPHNVSKPVGPYSHSYAIDFGGTKMIFVAGQCGTAPDGSIVGENDMFAQARQTLLNIQVILEANGASFADVIKTTTYLTDISRRSDVSRAREPFLAQPPPPSTLIEVPKLVDARYLIEMEVIAALPSERSPPNRRSPE